LLIVYVAAAAGGPTAVYQVAFKSGASGGHTALRSPSPTEEPCDNAVGAGFIPAQS
jgi:hypothetical protein